MAETSQALLEPFQLAFMQRALAATLVVGVLCAVVGAFVVWKGLAFVGDALAHDSFAGVAAAFVAGQSIYLGAGIAAVATAMSIAFLSRRARLSADTAIFSSADEFIAWKLPEESTSPTVKALRLFQDLLAFHSQDESPLARLDIDLARFAFGHAEAFGEEKDARYIAALQRFIETHREQEVHAEQERREVAATPGAAEQVRREHEGGAQIHRLREPGDDSHRSVERQHHGRYRRPLGGA